MFTAIPVIRAFRDHSELQYQPFFQLSALFSSIVPFSVFPILSLLLTVYCLHQRYQNRSMPVGLPGLAAAFFILGVLLYSTVVRAEYPDIGSNFFPAVLSVAMVFWIGYKMRNRKNTAAE